MMTTTMTMKIHFRTNLDEAQRDVNNLNSLDNDNSIVPRIRESIIFPFEKWDHDQKRSVNFQYSLEVVGVRYNYFDSVVEVELHMPKIGQTIAEWTAWFRKFRLGKDW